LTRWTFVGVGVAAGADAGGGAVFVGADDEQAAETPASRNRPESLLFNKPIAKTFRRRA
jgi:hypothetical protein